MYVNKVMVSVTLRSLSDRYHWPNYMAHLPPVKLATGRNEHRIVALGETAIYNLTDFIKSATPGIFQIVTRIFNRIGIITICRWKIGQMLNVYLCNIKQNKKIFHILGKLEHILVKWNHYIMYIINLLKYDNDLENWSIVHHAKL